ncbi:MAG: hypothetical protein J6R17_07660 [Bacteroidales bacterium]|nr:hypothetical protein [Bacteroidales bacterium]
MSAPKLHVAHFKPLGRPKSTYSYPFILSSGISGSSGVSGSSGSSGSSGVSGSSGSSGVSGSSGSSGVSGSSKVVKLNSSPYAVPTSFVA